MEMTRKKFMKNVHVLATDNPSRLNKVGNIWFNHKEPTECFENYNIYITSSDGKIEEEDWIIDLFRNIVSKANGISTEDCDLVLDSGASATIGQCRKIILTTDEQLINDGVEAIGDEFLEWFVHQ